MVATLLIWFLILIAGFSIGLLFKDLTEKCVYQSYKPTLSIVLTMVTGLSIIIILASTFSIYHKISLEFLILLSLLSLPKIKKTFFIIYKSSIQILSSSGKFHWLKLILFTVYFLLIIIQSIKEPFVSDTGLYHAQTIQWIEKYHAIKGLGNLHGRLAFNSSFHMLCAVFSFSFLNLATLYNCVQSFLLLIIGQYLINEVFKKNQPDLIKFLSAGSLLLLIIFYRDWVSSPSPDIPTTLFVILIFVFVYREVSYGSKNVFNYIAILLLSSTLLTIKLSAIPILVVFFLYFSKIKKNLLSPRIYFLSVCLLIFVFAPWITRNIILSGYLIYPFPAIDLFQFEWKVPYELALQEKEWVHSFAKVASYNWKEVEQLKFTEWFPIWWNKRNFVEQFIFGTLYLAPLLSIFLLLKSKYSCLKKYIVYLLLPSFIGVCFWFWMAPYFRFGHGFIIICFLTTVYLIFYKLRRVITLFTIGLTFCFTTYSLVKEWSEIKDIASNILLPTEYPDTDYKTVSIPGVQIKMPVDDPFCWNTPLPCSPYNWKGLKIIGDDIETGFQIKQDNKN